MIGQDFKAADFTDENFTLHLSRRKYDALQGTVPPFARTPGREENGRVYFKLNRQQVGDFLRALRPSICFAGVEEQFGYSESEIKSELFTSDERGVQYSGFEGLLRYARDVDMALFMSHWITEKPAWAVETEERR